MQATKAIIPIRRVDVVQLDDSHSDIVMPSAVTDVNLYQRRHAETDTLNSVTAKIRNVTPKVQSAKAIASLVSEKVINDTAIPKPVIAAKPESVEAEITTDVSDVEVLIAEKEPDNTHETFDELIEPFQVLANDSQSEITDMRDEPTLKVEQKTKAVSNFETFMAVQPVNEEPVTLEVIQNRAEEQPLEQTLAMLVEHLAETGGETEQDVIYEIIGEIKAALPACYVYAETEEREIHITPEMTGKLLIFLKALGYEQPSEVLISFVGHYDLTFLLQALEYICQLNDDNRQEFLLASSIAATDDDDNTRLRLGKLLFGLIAKLSPEPNI
jgi:hypothetical protein